MTAAAALLLQFPSPRATTPLATALCPPSESAVAPMATTTAPVAFAVCRKRFVCPQPKSECAPGEPTQVYPSRTVTISCTPTVVVQRTCGCPSCAPAPAASMTEWKPTVSMPAPTWTQMAEPSVSYTAAPPTITYSI